MIRSNFDPKFIREQTDEKGYVKATREEIETDPRVELVDGPFLDVKHIVDMVAEAFRNSSHAKMLRPGDSVGVQFMNNSDNELAGCGIVIRRPIGGSEH